ncbi:MAG TPA: imidazole glycerol phosphate synthase subunit HisH [bacterium]|mgnify:CR=1 FL=1|nr:imidazole glycerol phosphate synthase subunit HisH [bacterium]
MIVMVDYQAGNLRSVAKALEVSGGAVRVSGDWKDLKNADKVVLPGVGAFGRTVEALRERDLFGPILEHIGSGRPFLGICLGAQLLFEESAESPGIPGLAVFRGKCVRFSPGLKVPHLGWNRIRRKTDSPLWKDVPDGAFFYFAHSYYFRPKDPAVTAGETEYGGVYASAVWLENVYGLQFHPEKSQKWGLKVLENFVRL